MKRVDSEIHIDVEITDFNRSYTTIITDDLDFWKIVDTIVYVILLIFIAIGLIILL